ncbi:NAD+ diphosphatase [Pseudochelatococcus lubricantis]|uniref:NAD(+) diphosphatase n=1 Tax=Pseudochelatococcus lubricantis TaxID=1538102 RepID=A0ABX0UWR0_9HYPH|nr:NAD(+) diphosphatase [Pseudochelatococcus lubricantis]NIJ56714.1 NAD+ diphosphatase [Pseudochelatococcus lubricantis]
MTRDANAEPEIRPFTARELSAHTAFARNRLNRHSERREIESELAALRVDPRTRVFLIVGDAPLLKTEGGSERARFTFAQAAEIGQEQESAYLGTLDDTPLFALLFPETATEAFSGRGDVAPVGLRAIAAEGLLPADELGPLGEAKALMDWHRRHRFCANCGAPTVTFTGGFRRDCPSCEAQHFPRVDPVVIMLVTDGDRCLLGRQPRFAPGMYSALAGFVEQGETVEDAVRREVMEEAGVPVGTVRYLASQPWPFPSSLMIGCVARALATTIVVDRLELEDARWFTREEARLMLADGHPDGLTAPRPMAIAHHLLRAFVEAEGDIV